METTLSKIENDKTIKHNIITGEFNTDLIKFDLNDNTNEYLNTILKNGFIQTRVTSHTCTLIDHNIYHQSRNSGIQILSGNLMTDMSDHFTNFIIFHSKNRNIAVDRPTVRIFSDKNKTTFQNLLSTIVNWENEMSDRNANEAMTIFNQKLTIAYNKSFPFVKLSRKRSKPWITIGLKQSINPSFTTGGGGGGEPTPKRFFFDNF